VIFILEGSMCLVKDGPGQADFSAFSRTQNALALDHLRIATPLITELGVPFATDIRLRMGGDEMTKEVSHSTTEVISVSTAAIPDAVFQIPADYKVRKQ
jgi:hypothetical protein